ncbi:unnamed protein product [Phyllotreta striolata]|uniref:Methenyltetrahydrofolate synthase domain-containing protein n=1 Tax=Phyllotreta striolata TaxID=444603 RepID=A0A9N9TND9_PHYSR|nr:unnamed protein product [Phyllotreta striolata]
MSESQAQMEPLQPDETKFTIRKKVWAHMSKNKLAVFPKPYGRIPNFQGAEEAAARLLDLGPFRDAKAIEVNPDKPLAPARALVLAQHKELYVPFPRLQECLMKKLQMDEKLDVKMVVSRWGIEHTGTKIDMKEEGIAIDLLVLGSVAVSKDGRRIGKGAGFADLEFGIFKELKAITDETVVVTIVHDSQVFDELPAKLFQKYDVPVDYILTPTRTIKVEEKLPRPEGIFWHELTKGQLKGRKVLLELREKHEKEGRDVTLKVPNPDDPPNRFPLFRRRFDFKRRQNRSYYQNRTMKDQIQNDNGQKDGALRRVVKFKDSKSDNTQENLENIPPQNKIKKKKKKPHIDYSLRVSNIQKNVRVRDFKMALREKGIKPNNITWKGSRGYCYLHYAKTNQKVEKDSEAINGVIEMIQDLKINSNVEKNLNVKVMEPITRIETVDVTAV